jgi:tetratricopeptide (TPR) repeat protein
MTVVGRADPARTLQDRYELLELAGAGGQGEVWRAHDVRHDRTVAVKIRDGTQTDAARVIAEAGVLLELQPHPNVPTVREDFYADDGFCVVMDWVEGRSLRQLVKDHGEAAVDYEAAIGYLEQVASALDHLHGHEPPIVHQDVKPANIVITTGERAVLVDFGIAKSTTSPGSMYKGTPGFIAPEVSVGGPATPASDIFAFGVTAYVLLTGALPEPGTTAELLGVPLEARGRVREALVRAMSIDPMVRPVTASAFVAALRPRDEPSVTSAETVAEVERAISSMDDATREILELASVIGPDFRTETIAVALDGATVEPVLARAVARGMIVQLGSDRHAFSPSQLGPRLYDGMMRARKAELHARVGAALEHLHADELDPYVAEIANHYCAAAGISVSGIRASRFARAAAEQAMRAHAYDDAVRWFEQALSTAELAGSQDLEERCRTLILLVGALRGVGELTRATEVACDAIPIARELGDTGLFVRAVRQFAAIERSFIEEREAIAFLEEAIELVGPGDTAIRAHLLATLGAKLTFAMRPDRVPGLMDEALAIARRIDDPGLISQMLFHRSRAWTTPARTHDRIAEMEEAYLLSETARGDGAERNALIELISASMELGDRERIERELPRLVDVVQEKGNLMSMWYFTLIETALCIVDGRLDEAERCAERALEIGSRTQEPDALLNYGVQIALIRREQGRFDDIVALVQDASARFPDASVWWAAQAYLDTETGQSDRARQRLRELPGHIDAIPFDQFWLVEMLLWAEACVNLRDVEIATPIRDALLPYADRFAVLGVGAGIWGSVARLLGELEDVLGNIDAASEFFAQALDGSERLGMGAEVDRIRSRST